MDVTKWKLNFVSCNLIWSYICDFGENWNPFKSIYIEKNVSSWRYAGKYFYLVELEETFKKFSRVLKQSFARLPVIIYFCPNLHSTRMRNKQIITTYKTRTTMLNKRSPSNQVENKQTSKQ